LRLYSVASNDTCEDAAVRAVEILRLVLVDGHEGTHRDREKGDLAVPISRKSDQDTSGGRSEYVRDASHVFVLDEGVPKGLECTK